MNYAEVLIGHAQFAVALAGFASLMLGLARGRKSIALSAWAARVVVVLSMYSGSMCIVSLSLLSTSLSLSHVWFLSSIVCIVAGTGGVALLIWDSQRVYKSGIREQHLSVTVACWLLGVITLSLNFVNLMVHEANFFYFYGSLITTAIPALVLFLQNIILLSNDPRKTR